MRPITARQPAASRSAAAARLAAVAGLVVLVGLGLLVMGMSAGFFVALSALLAFLLLMRRHLDTADLAAIGDRPVLEVAERTPSLTGDLSGQALMNHLADHPDAHHWLVASPHGWLVASTSLLMDTALTTRGTIEIHHLGRRVRHVDGSLAIDRLPRMPLRDEVWMVEGPAIPRLLTREDLLDARFSSSPPEEESAPAPEDAAEPPRPRTVVLPGPSHGVPA